MGTIPILGMEKIVVMGPVGPGRAYFSETSGEDGKVITDDSANTGKEVMVEAAGLAQEITTTTYNPMVLMKMITIKNRS